MCDECWRFRVGPRGAGRCDRPACVACAYVASSHRARRTALAFAFLALTVGASVLAALRWRLWADYLALLVVFLVIAVALFVGLLVTARESPLVVQERTDDEPDAHALDRAEHPYRARGRRVVAALSPKLSGKTAALVAGLSFALTAVLLPVALSLPRWLEIEVVLAAWWLLSALGFAALLHRGFHLVDDYVYFAPWNRPSSAGEAAHLGAEGCSGYAPDDLEGCLIGLLFALLAALLFGAAWLLVEIAAPLLFLLVYLLVTRALTRVARDRHDCRGAPARALAWGALWATIYLLPLAALAYGIHAAASS
jgi:hypothetical protein